MTNTKYEGLVQLWWNSADGNACEELASIWNADEAQLQAELASFWEHARHHVSDEDLAEYEAGTITAEIDRRVVWEA